MFWQKSMLGQMLDGSELITAAREVHMSSMEICGNIQPKSEEGVISSKENECC